MPSKEIQAAADRLAEYAMIGAEAVDTWVTLALEQPDRGSSVSTLVAAALNRLNRVPEKLDVKAEARLQLLDMRRAVLDDRLAEYAMIRAEAVDTWVTLALEQPDPGSWVSTLVAAALNRLNRVPEKLDVKAEARLQLLDMRTAILDGIVKHRKEPPRILPSQVATA